MKAMKVMINKVQADWINSNVVPCMDFMEIVAFGDVMYKFSQGYMASHLTEDLLKKIIELCINHDMYRHVTFYALCAKMNKINVVNAKKDTPAYCIRFDNTPPMKIPSIKAMRELLRHDTFRVIEKGLVYDSGLREMKDAVEGGIVLGPYDQEQVSLIKAILAGTPYSVEKYNGQKTLKDVQF